VSFGPSPGARNVPLRSLRMRARIAIMGDEVSADCFVCREHWGQGHPPMVYMLERNRRPYGVALHADFREETAYAG